MAWIVFLPSILMLVGIVVLLRPPRRPRWLAALGWLALFTLPAVASHLAWVASDASPYSAGAGGLARMGGLGLWVLLGGRTAIAAFEGLAGLGMSRQTTMLDNVHVFFLLVLVQTAVLLWILLRARRLARPALVWLAVGIAVLANALLGAHWPFWGS